MAIGFELQKDDYVTLEANLQIFQKGAEVRGAFICDSGGNIIIEVGKAASCVDSVSALASGAFSATRALAHAIGEDEFSSIVHQGSRNNIFMSAVDEEVLLVAVFGQETNNGLVKLEGTKACRKLLPIFRDIMKRPTVPNEDPTVTFVLAQGPLFSR